MSPRFRYYLKIVAAVHIVGLLVILLYPSLCNLFRKKPETLVPIEFMVEVPPEPLPEVAPEPEPVLPEPPREKPKPPKKDKKIERSNRKIKRNNDPKPPRKTLSPEEIKRLLAQGAKPADRTVIPDEDSRGFEMVRKALYRAWSQPSAAEAGDAIAEVSIRLGDGGRVLAAEMVKGSGNTAFDSSVKLALAAVKSIPRLPAGFVMRHNVVTVAFRVE